MGSANHNSGESGEWQMMNFQPMPLLKRAAPFDDPDWIYELKMDGFRATPSSSMAVLSCSHATGIRSLRSQSLESKSPLHCRM